MMGAVVYPALLLLIASAYPIARIQVEGNVRYTQEAVIQGSGLRVGAQATPEDFEAACKRLADTGLFTSARFRYKPAGEAFDLTLMVEEAQEVEEIRIELPDFDEARVWAWLGENEPLVQKQMPTNEQATAFYCRAVERFLEAQGKKEAVVARMRTDPASGVIATTLRPAVMPHIAAVKFEGTQALPAATLEAALAKAAAGSEYTESGFRELLDYNVRRLYEEQGLLGVSFPRITAAKDASGGVVVTTTVVEGPVYRVGAIEIAGDRLPVERLKSVVELKPGDVAGWKKAALDMARIQGTLGREGYLDASCEIEKHLDPARAVADLTFVVEKGPQAKLGALRLDGLPEPSATRARALWKLKPGDVLNTDLVDQFERALMRDDRIRFERISRRYEPAGAASGAVDVVFTFKGPK
ncbi:MAG: POTRA domain-containing protein [Acidobacteriota bacterium]